MPDFPGVAQELPHVNLSTFGMNSMVGQAAVATSAVSATAAWPSANRALFVPVQIDVPCTVVKMAFQVGVQSGNYDIGIYDEHANRIVSLGSTAVPVPGIAIADIADTVLTPGTYFLALNVDNITATIARCIINISVSEACGVQQQAVGAVTLPDPAVFANPASTAVPVIVATTVPTI